MCWGARGAFPTQGLFYLGYTAQSKRQHLAPCSNLMTCPKTFWQASVTAGLTSNMIRTRNFSPLFSKSESILSRDEKPNPQKLRWGQKSQHLGVRKGKTDSSQTDSRSQETLALPACLAGSQDLRAETTPRNHQKTSPVKRSSKKRRSSARA